MFRTPRGTKDILPEEQALWRFFEAGARQIAARFGYGRIDTPIFEDSHLFSRGIGEITDIVEKETYTFRDRGDNLLTLRPEGTASVCRAYLEHGMHNRPQPVRLYYYCPFFRYERPQAGRYRQYQQFGVEVLGEADSSVDAEVIEVAWRLLDHVGVTQLSLLVNSIGDPQCRPAYVQRLQAHYRHRTSELCADCLRRLESNPMRLLDCKQESCQPTIDSAPSSVESLCGACSDHWASFLTYLELLGLPFTVENRLVRGFDYYTRTVFEIVPPVEGRQSTIVGGGRYDGLIEQLGGRPTPGIGFGMGVERVIQNLAGWEEAAGHPSEPKVIVAHLGDAGKHAAIKAASTLRKDGLAAVLAPSGRSLRSQLRYATAESATHVVIIGDNELEKGAFVVRDLGKSEQREVSPECLSKAIRAS